MYYTYLADLVVAVHIVYVGFVVLGQLAIVIGLLRKWDWIRNFGFRLAHLLAIGIVAVEAVGHITCPLTAWENQLRQLGGQTVADGTFVGRLFHNLLFYDAPQWIFEQLHIAFAVIVLVTFVLAPPRWPARLKQSGPAATS